MVKYCFEQTGWEVWQYYLTQYKINKSNLWPKVFLKGGGEGEEKESAISTVLSFILFLLRTKTRSFWSTSCIWMNGYLQELACVWDTSFWNEKQSLILSHSLTRSYVIQHLQVCSFPFTFNKIWLIVTSCFSDTQLLLPKPTPASLFHHCHLPLTCYFLFYKKNGIQERNSGAKTPTLELLS